MPGNRKKLVGVALLSAVVALNVSFGNDAPLSEKKTAAPQATIKSEKTSRRIPTAIQKSDAAPVKKGDSREVNDPEGAVMQSTDEAAIRLTGESYVKAYCSGDATALAAHFTEDAEYVDEQSETHQGRDAIEEAMRVLFAERTGGQIELDIENLRMVSPGVAIEDGTTTFTSQDGTDRVQSQYTAVHVKTNGKWLAASVREHAPKDRRQHRTQLSQLGWLKGTWVEESDDSLVLFSCEEVADGNFFVRDFETHVGGRAGIGGNQRIGWDPLTAKLRTWIFESDGGYSDGFWHHDADCWSLKTTGVTANGQPVSSTSTYTYVNNHTMKWQSVDREVAGVTLPDSDEITIVRRAPIPEIIAEKPISSSK